MHSNVTTPMLPLTRRIILCKWTLQPQTYSKGMIGLETSAGTDNQHFSRSLLDWFFIIRMLSDNKASLHFFDAILLLSKV